MGKVRIFKVTNLDCHITFYILCSLGITSFHYFAYELVFKTGQNVLETVTVPILQVKGYGTTSVNSFQEKSEEK